MTTLRSRAYHLFENPKDHRRGHFVHSALSVLILANIAAVIFETVPGFHDRYRTAFYAFELFSIAVFTFEYVVRLWSAPENPQFAHPLFGRLRYAVTPFAIIDLSSIIPFYLPFLSVDLRSLRALRLLRLVRILKVTRQFESLQVFLRVFKRKWPDLTVALFVGAVLLVMTSSLMYHLEHDAQPDKFSSIPAAMWWAAVTLTTVGYGDVFPVTLGGKLLGSLVAVLGIGMIALPASILGSGFVDEIHRAQPPTCPHCGKEL
jgi:voltage-gated potassium channel